MKKNALLTIAVLLAGMVLHASNAPKEDERVAFGIFPNGMSYYAVQNSRSAGFADFALVCRNCGDSGVSPVDLLSKKGRISGQSFQKFLSDNSIAPAKNGYAVTGNGNMTLSFRSVLLDRNPTLADSLILALFDAAEQLALKDVPLSDMAVVVAGDIDRAAMVGKMRIFSYMVRQGRVEKKCTADPADANKPEAGIMTEDCGKYVRVSAVFPYRTGDMRKGGTDSYAVVRQMASTLGAVAVHAAGRALDSVSIPFSDMGYEIRCMESEGGLAGWDGIEIGFSTLPFCKDAAAEAFSGALASLKDMCYEELRLSSRKDFAETVFKPSLSNQEYVQLCSDSFLNGLPLVRDVDFIGFCRSKSVSSGTGVALMKAFAEAVIPETIDSSSAKLPGCSLPLADTLRLPGVSDRKARLRTAVDNMTGGQIYTAPNGFKVYFKRVPGAKKIHWGFNVGRGYYDVPDLKPGQAALLSEMLPLYSVCGIKASDFADILAYNGITVESNVGLYSTSLSGVVHHNSIEFLMKALAGCFKEISPDTTAFSRYIRRSAVDIAVENVRKSRIATVDSLLCAGNPYSEVKITENLDDSLLVKSVQLYQNIFSGAKGSFMVIAGDIEEKRVKTAIENCALLFPMTGEVRHKRRVMFQPVSGWSSTYRKGESPSVDILLSAAVPMTAENLCASMLATGIFGEKVRSALVGTGYTSEVYYSFTQYPRERFNILISSDLISAEGYDVSESENLPVLDVLSRLRGSLDDGTMTDFSEDILNAYKKLINSNYTDTMQDPAYWVDIIIRRHADGRDLHSKMADKLNSVKPERVQSVLRALLEGSRIELITTE